MSNLSAAVLEPIGRAQMVLESADVQASLRGLFCEATVTQVYRNLESVNVEAVYTFPLPADAVLLDLSLELNGKTMRGVVRPSAAAEERYEEAVTDGDSAVLLQQIEPGLFSVNVGNLLAGERAVVRFQYGVLHCWQGDHLRLHLPTTIAPRYGNPTAAGLAPHQVPEHSFTATHGFSLSVNIEGELAAADFECPSHSIAVSTVDGARRISLSGGAAVMDRDFVLVLTKREGERGQALTTKDQETFVTLASFNPTIPADMPLSPRCVKLVVDCSGSMCGDSIAQAKVALHEILSLLKPNDWFSLVTFGSSPRVLFPEPVSANDANIKVAAAFVGEIDADMGGTEIGEALRAAYDIGTVENLPSDVLLITDGEIWDSETIIDVARASDHRIFTVGVGSAVAEAFVRGIAQATGGACELVSPREAMAARIIRHFQRIDQPMAVSAEVIWPAGVARQCPECIECVYAGDTLHVFGWQTAAPKGEVTLRLTFVGDRQVNQSAEFRHAPESEDGKANSLARLAAYNRLSNLDEIDATDLAVRYRLITRHTSCVLVVDREDAEKPGDIPVLRQVPQLQAVGSVAPEWALSLEVQDFSHKLRFGGDLAVEALPARSVRRLGRRIASPVDDVEQLVQAYHAEVAASNERLDVNGIAELLREILKARVRVGVRRSRDLTQIAALTERDFVDELASLLQAGNSIRDVLAAFLVVLASTDDDKRMPRDARRMIRKIEKETPLRPSLVEAVTGLVEWEPASANIGSYRT